MLSSVFEQRHVKDFIAHINIYLCLKRRLPGGVRKPRLRLKYFLMPEFMEREKGLGFVCFLYSFLCCPCYKVAVVVVVEGGQS